MVRAGDNVSTVQRTEAEECEIGFLTYHEVPQSIDNFLREITIHCLSTGSWTV